MTEPVAAVPDPAELRKLLAGLKELPPKVRTSTRRELRHVGDDVIAEQRAILDGPLPGKTAKTGQRRVVQLNKKTGKYRTVIRNIYTDTASAGGKSRGLREGIKAGLKLRIVTGKTRQGLDIRSTEKVGGRFYQSVRFRHPNFGGKTWSYQLGKPYFFRPAVDGRDRLVAAATEVLNKATESI